MSDYVLTEAQRNEINQKLATQHAEIATLRSDLAKAREEIKRWEDKEVNRAVNCCGQEERALLAERARDEAVAEVEQLKKERDVALEKSERNYEPIKAWIAKYPDRAVNRMWWAMCEAEEQRDEALAELKKVKEAAQAILAENDAERAECYEANGNIFTCIACQNTAKRDEPLRIALKESK